METSAATCLIATEGCILYRQGDSEGGGQKYREAIEAAVTHGDNQVAQRAAIHWLHEEGRAGRHLDKESVQSFRNFYEKDNSVNETTRDLFRVQVTPFLEEAEHRHFIADIHEVVRGLIASKGTSDLRGP